MLRILKIPNMLISNFKSYISRYRNNPQIPFFIYGQESQEIEEIVNYIDSITQSSWSIYVISLDPIFIIFRNNNFVHVISSFFSRSSFDILSFIEVILILYNHNELNSKEHIIFI